MEQHCPVLQIVGYKNSGKTKLVENLIHVSNQNGLQTASIKHHGHGGYPISNNVNNDSSRHHCAGAFLSSVEGDGMLYLQAFQESWTLQELVRIYQTFQPDIIFVEGYKQADYPKVVLLRDKDDIHLLEDCSNIIGVSGPKRLSSRIDQYSFYSMDNKDTPAQIFQKVMRSE